MDQPQGIPSSDSINKLVRTPLIRMCQMPSEMKQEAIEACMGSLEKHPSDYERCAQAAKETLDKKFGSAWCVVMGKSFSYKVTHAKQHLFFYLGSASVGFLVWRI